MSTSSTPASIRLAVEASAASTRSWIVWPANDDRFTVAVAQAPARLVAAPAWLNTTVVVPTGDHADPEEVGAGGVVEVGQVPRERQRDACRCGSAIGGRQALRGAAVDVEGTGRRAGGAPGHQVVAAATWWCRAAA